MFSLAVYIIIFLLALIPPIYYQFVYHDKDCEERYNAVRRNIEKLKTEEKEVLAQINALREQSPTVASHYDSMKNSSEFLTTRFPAYFHLGLRGAMMKIEEVALSPASNAGAHLLSLEGDKFSKLVLRHVSKELSDLPFGIAGVFAHFITIEQEGTQARLIGINGAGDLKLLVYLENGSISLTGWPRGRLYGGDTQEVGTYSPIVLPHLATSSLPSIKLLTSRCKRKLYEVIECLHSGNLEN